MDTEAFVVNLFIFSIMFTVSYAVIGYLLDRRYNRKDRK
jgi:divalent metal cation (Fe/Co/Zn/Cd) transporter